MLCMPQSQGSPVSVGCDCCNWQPWLTCKASSSKSQNVWEKKELHAIFLKKKPYTPAKLANCSNINQQIKETCEIFLGEKKLTCKASSS